MRAVNFLNFALTLACMSLAGASYDFNPRLEDSHTLFNITTSFENVVGSHVKSVEGWIRTNEVVVTDVPCNATQNPNEYMDVSWHECLNMFLSHRFFGSNYVTFFTDGVSRGGSTDATQLVPFFGPQYHDVPLAVGPPLLAKKAPLAFDNLQGCNVKVDDFITAGGTALPDDDSSQEYDKVTSYFYGHPKLDDDNTFIDAHKGRTCTEDCPCTAPLESNDDGSNLETGRYESILTQLNCHTSKTLRICKKASGGSTGPAGPAGADGKDGAAGPKGERGPAGAGGCIGRVSICGTAE